MIKKLTRHGNSLALVLDRPVLDLLKIQPDTPLEVTTDGANLIISPIREGAQDARIQEALRTANARYGRMLKRLGE
jgi:antitoxin MazE